MKLIFCYRQGSLVRSIDDISIGSIKTVLLRILDLNLHNGVNAAAISFPH